MKQTSPSLQLLMNLAKASAILSRRFDASLGGLGFNEFSILYHLSQAENLKLRRVDLANKMGLTPAGVTRILLGMEKVGLTAKESNPDDARVSFVLLTSAGKRKLNEAFQRAELLTAELMETANTSVIDLFSQLLKQISR